MILVILFITSIILSVYLFKKDYVFSFLIGFLLALYTLASILVFRNTINNLIKQRSILQEALNLEASRTQFIKDIIIFNTELKDTQRKGKSIQFNWIFKLELQNIKIL